MTAAPFTGAVLCGGASRRMGRDKALLEVGGRPLVTIAAAALRDAGAARVVCIGGDLPALRALGLEALADLYPGEGPLGGLLTALSAVAAEPAAVLHLLTCDLPAVDASVVRPVQAALAGEPRAAIAAPRIEGRLQLLSAAYRGELVREQATRAFAAGGRAVRAGLAGLPVLPVDGLDPWRLADADTPEALAGLGAPHPSTTVGDGPAGVG